MRIPLPLCVLVVEHSEQSTRRVMRELRLGGYEPVHRRVETAGAMLAALKQQTWDVVVAAFILPEFSASAALELLQENGFDLPFVVISGDTGEDIAAATIKIACDNAATHGQYVGVFPAVSQLLRKAAAPQPQLRPEDRIRMCDMHFRQFIQHMTEVFWIAEPSTQRILYVSPGYEKIWCRTCDSLYADPSSWLDAIHPDDRERIRATASRLSGTYDEEYRIIRPDGSIRWIHDRAFAARHERGQGYRVTGIAEDVTERKHAEQMIQHMASYDSLTALPNRNHLYVCVEKATHGRNADNNIFALLLIDLGHFSEITHVLGHDCGDSVLKEVGTRLQIALFAPDVVARLGGDRFGILLSRLARIDDVDVVIQKIREALYPTITIEGVSIMIDAAIGVALFPEHGDDAETLLSHADIAMHAAKKYGVCHVVYDRQMNPHNPRRLILMGELRQATEQNHLTLYYQPKINVRRGEVCGAEALVRWRHPERGLIPPDEFIGPAEQTGLIHPLTQWVLRTAISQCGAWGRQGLTMPIAINLSARNLFDPTLPDQVAQLVREQGVSPTCLTMEITESAIMTDTARAVDILLKLRAIGVKIAVDDYGIGYSSLSYLRKLPIDGIKIDKSFVMHMLENESDATIVRSTIELAHKLGLEIVAEGVESRGAYELLMAWGCDIAQGYYISKPLPVCEYGRWLHESPYIISRDMCHRCRAMVGVDFAGLRIATGR